MSRSTVIPALFLAALVGTAPAIAQDVALHAGVGVTGELDTHDGAGTPGDFSNVVDDQSGTFFVGAEFGKGFGVEAAYLNVGDGLWSLGATHVWHRGSFEPYVKAGWFSHDGDDAGSSYSSSSDDGLMAELGLRWKPVRAFAIRLGYGWYDFDAGADGSAQLALEWHF